jgi:hypothetical protein
MPEGVFLRSYDSCQLYLSNGFVEYSQMLEGGPCDRTAVRCSSVLSKGRRFESFKYGILSTVLLTLVFNLS